MALTTLARVKELLGIKADDGQHDALLAETIERVSKELSTTCGRVFEFESALTEFYDGDGKTRTLLLRRAPIVTITTIHDDINRTYGTATLIQATDYVIDKDAGLVTLDGFAFATGLQNIRVIYDAGYKVIPQDLEEAGLVICAETFWDLHGELRTLIANSDQIIERIASLRKRARETLDRYVRVTM